MFRGFRRNKLFLCHTNPGHVFFGGAGQNRTWTNPVDANVEGRKVHRHVSCHLKNCTLSWTVSYKVRLSDKTRNRTQIYNCSTANLLHMLRIELGQQCSTHNVD